MGTSSGNKNSFKTKFSLKIYKDLHYIYALISVVT